MASPSLWRVGIAADLAEHVLDVPLMLIISVLLNPTSRNLALLALLLTLVQTAVLVANESNLLSALFFLGTDGYLKSFDPNQLYTLAHISIKIHDYGFGVGLIFFGFACIVEGYVIYKSGYLPGTIGVLMQIAGLYYLAQSFALLLSPGLADMISPALMLPSFVAELSFCLWLIVKGVNVPKWREKTGAGQPTVS